jgi:opine dehydrogenase
MKETRLSILGGGNGAYACASDLKLAGFDVILWEFPEFKERIVPILEGGGIELKGPGRHGFAPLKATTNIEEALHGSSLILISIPAFGHRRVAELCGPYLKGGQCVLLCPGSTGGALEFAHVLKTKSLGEEVHLGETATLPYACRLSGHAEVEIKVRCPWILAAAFPGKDTQKFVSLVNSLFPGLSPAINVLETGLNNGNLLAHPAATLLNSGRIEFSKGEFYLFQEGFTPSVGRVVQTIENERLELCRVLGYQRIPSEERILKLGYHTKRATSLAEAYGTSPVFRSLKGPGSLQDRYISEDVRYGLVLLSSLGEMLGVPTPTIDTIIHLASVINGMDYKREGRTVESLGIAGMGVDELNRFLQEGIWR